MGHVQSWAIEFTMCCCNTVLTWCVFRIFFFFEVLFPRCLIYFKFIRLSHIDWRNFHVSSGVCKPRNIKFSFFLISEYDNVAERAGKIEAEVKRLHNIIVEINNHKLKAQQDKLDKINKQLDECASAITKAQVAIKTADR